MRAITSGLIAMLMLAAPAQAQRPAAPVIPSVPAPRDPPPHFTIAPRGGALSPIGLPLPRIGLQPPAKAREHGRHFRNGALVPGAFVPWPMMVFYVPQPVAVPEPSAEYVPAPVERKPAFGRLILDVEPATAQVFADGYYVGAPEDFSIARGGGLLEAGTHRIDVNAAGFESMTLEIRVTDSQPVTVRGALKTLPPPVALPPTTFYLIPGCYMGNIPPKEARLSATCDLSRTVRWNP